MKIVNSILCIAFVLYSFPGYAKCGKAVQFVEAGKPAPCSGFLFSPEKEQEVRIKLQVSSTLESLVKKQQESIDNLDARIANLQNYNNYLSTELEKQDKFNFWKTTLYFSLGVLVTGAIATNVK